MFTLLNDINKGLYFVAGEASGLRRPIEEELAQLKAAQAEAIAEREAIDNAAIEGMRVSALSGQRAAEPAPRGDYPRIPEYIELEGGGWLFNARTHRFNEEEERVEVLPYSSLTEIIGIKELMDSEVARINARAREAERQAELIDTANQERLYALEERVKELEAKVAELEGPHGWQVDSEWHGDLAPDGPPVDNTGERDEGKPPIEWEVGSDAPQQGDKEAGK